MNETESPQPAAPRTPEGAGGTIARNSAWLLAGKLGASLLSLLFNAFAANKLRAIGYGQLNFILSLGSFVQVLLDLGYMTLLMERSSKDRSALERHYSGNLGLKLLLYPAGLALYSCYLLAFPYRGAELTVFFLGYAFVVLNTQTYLVRGALMSLEKFGAPGKSEVIERAIVLVAGLAVLFAFPSLLPFLAVLVAASCARLLYLQHHLSLAGIRGRWRWDGEYVRENFRAALPHALYSLTGMLHYRIDHFMVGVLRNDMEVGLYSVAYEKVFGIVMFGLMVSNALMPTASRVFATDKAEFRRIFDRAFFMFPVLAAPVAVGVGVCATGIIRLLHTDEFSASATALMWFAPYVLLRCWTYLYGAMLLAAGRIGVHVKAEAIGIMCKVALNLLLVPAHGFLGAAVAFAIAEVIVLVADAFLARTIGLPFLPVHRAWQPLLAAAIMGGCVWAARGFGVLVQIPLGAVVYAALCLAFGVHRREPGIQAIIERVVARVRDPRAA